MHLTRTHTELDQVVGCNGRLSFRRYEPCRRAVQNTPSASLERRIGGSGTGRAPGTKSSAHCFSAGIRFARAPIPKDQVPACDARGQNRSCGHSYRTARRTARARRARTDPVGADTTVVLSFHSIPPLSMLDGRPRRTIQHTMSRAGSSALNLRAELVSATRSARPQCRRRRLKRHWRGHVNVPNNAGYRSAREHYACTHRSGGVDSAIRRTHSRPTDDARSIAADSSGRRPSSRREASQKSDCRGRSGREIASDSTGQGFDRTGVHAGGRDSSVSMVRKQFALTAGLV